MSLSVRLLPATVLLLASGCSLLIEGEVTCSTDSDCAEGARCAAGLCVAGAPDASGVQDHSIGGTVSGLTGSGLVLQNGSEQLPVAANGPFTFAQRVPHGETYAVTVSAQPAGQTCTVASGSGTATSDVTAIAIACSSGFSVGGTVSGLNGTLVLQNNGGDDLSLTADGPFTFATRLASGAAYLVTVATQPDGLTCVVNNGSGTLTANVTSVSVVCSPTTHTVGGTVTGLSGTLVLRNNGGDDLTVTGDGPFTFAGSLAQGAAYAVTVFTEPTGQVCVIENGTGTATANVVNVTVTCAFTTHTIGGSATGLSGTLVLQNEGGDDLTLTAIGPFTFATEVAYGSTYLVTVATQPAGQTCAVNRGTGTVTGDVTDVAVICSSVAFTVSGTVTGASGPVVLRNNGGDDVTVNGAGPFSFPTPVPEGADYLVTVAAHPTGQTCTVANASGPATADVTNVVVTCAASTYSISGTVTGLTGTATVVLQNNGGDDVTVGNGAFSFGTRITHGQTYEVTVPNQPVGHQCTLANGSGTATAAVTNVAVTCQRLTYSIGGTVSGLSGTVVLQNNGGDDLPLTANEAFAFLTELAHGESYEVTVATQPAGQTCSVANGSGTATADVTTVAITCAASTWEVAGTVSGLSGTLVLQNNGADDLTVAADGPFAFATEMAHGGAYSVTVSTQPSGQRCTVANGGGTATADVTDVSVTCVNVYGIGGSLSGLSGTVVLQNNGGDDLTLNADGGFSFETEIAQGQPYEVTVATQPDGQTCSVANGSGTATADVTSVAITCASNTYEIAGTVTGLTGTVVLQNNGGDDVTVNADGSFAFATEVAHGQAYSVTVSTQPSGQRCTVADGAGTATADVSAVVVTCVNVYSIGGSVSGLTGTVVLQNNDGDNLSLDADGSFTFSIQVAQGQPYDVTVLTHPAGQTCSVSNGSGTATGEVTSVVVTCAAADSYTIGGSLSGLSGTVVLQNNGGDDLTLDADGTFTFSTPVGQGQPYEVTVATQPVGQVCSVANGSGVVTEAVTNVEVTCCLDPCPSEGASVCTDGGVQMCEALPNGCLAWSDSEACPSGFCADASSCGRAVSAGGAHNLRIKSDGSLACWGSNVYGQCTWAPVGPFSQVSAGSAASCALQASDGTAVCDDITPPAGVALKQVSVGGNMACGIKQADDTLTCWWSSGNPAPPAGAFVQLDLGWYHGCALTSDGAVSCWGDNSYGQTDVPPGTYKQVSAGYWHTCAIAEDDTVVCWGRNTFGESTPPLGTFKQIAADGAWSCCSDFFTCGLKTDGTLACWGSNSHGQLSAPSGQFLQVSCGGAHACAVAADGTVSCWGENADGQAQVPPEANE